MQWSGELHNQKHLPLDHNNRYIALQLVGIMQLYAIEKDHIVYGALYSGNQEAVMPFIENEEVSQITYWDGRSDIGYIDEIDRKLTELV